MNTQMISAEELKMLANKNKEMKIEQMINDDVLEVVHHAIEKGLRLWNESFEHMVKKEAEIKITDYQLTSASEFLLSRFQKEMAMFSFKVMGAEGKHSIVVETEKLKSLYETIKGHSLEEELSLNQLLQPLENGLKLFYRRFCEELNVTMNIEADSCGYLTMSEASLSELDLNARHEIKVYELKVNEVSLYVLHLSDMDFMDYVYSQINLETSDEFFYEDLMDESALIGESSFLDVKKPLFSTFEEVEETQGTHNLGLLYDVPLELSVVLGKTKRSIREILEINTGKIIELDKYADDPLEIYCNGKLIAEGEVVVVDDNFGVKVTKLHQGGLKNIK